MFLHKIFIKLGPVWNATLNPNFCISFLIFGPVLGTQGMGNYLFFVSVIIIIIITIIIVIIVINIIIILFKVVLQAWLVANKKQ